MTATVLIVDDSEFIRQALRRALDADGRIRVAAAKNGKEALDILAADPTVRLMILDLNMPILDGREVLRRLDEHATHPIFIVAVGDRDDDAALEECVALGAHRTLTKPLDVEGLVAMLRSALERSEASW